MIGKRTLRETPVTIAEALEILEKQGELEASQRMARDYAQKFSRVNAEKARKMKEELLKLGKLSERHVVMIIDLMPKKKTDIELLFARERVKLDDKDCEAILQILEKYS